MMHRVPLVMRWPAGIKNPGRRVEERQLCRFCRDLHRSQQGDAEAGMELSGKSLRISSDEPTHPRDFVLIGRNE